MHILFLSHYFPPEVNAPASRTFEHCRQWVRDGHKVTVVTCAPNHPRGKVYDGYKNRFYCREEMAGIQVVRLWTFVTANEGFLKRTINYISYMVAAIIAAPFLKSADVVISTSPQFFNGLAGYFVSRLKRAPWVLEIRDLWPESILTVGAIRNRYLIRMLEYLEMFSYRKADRIVPVTDAFAVYMQNKGISAEKIKVIKNGVDLAFYRISNEGEDIKQNLGIKGRFVAAYFGTHGMAHHLETILEAAEILLDRKDIAFLLIGDGAERKRLLSMKEEKNLTNVLMLEQVDKKRMPAYWSAVDASLVLLKKSDLFKTVLPSKIFESMAMKKPIVLGVEGESRQLIDEACAGIAIEPESGEELASAISRLVDTPGLCHGFGENGYKFVESNFNRVTLARRFSGLLEDVIKR